MYRYYKNSKNQLFLDQKNKKNIRALRESEIIISAGPAGTGKTFLAVAIGLTMLLEKNRKNNFIKTCC